MTVKLCSLLPSEKGKRRFKFSNPHDTKPHRSRCPLLRCVLLCGLRTQQGQGAECPVVQFLSGNVGGLH